MYITHSTVASLSKRLRYNLGNVSVNIIKILVINDFDNEPAAAINCGLIPPCEDLVTVCVCVCGKSSYKTMLCTYTAPRKLPRSSL